MKILSSFLIIITIIIIILTTCKPVRLSFFWETLNIYIFFAFLW